MDKKEKLEPGIKDEKHEHPHGPHGRAECHCGPDCRCGCHEGKECHCGCDGCKCRKRMFKVVAVLIIFLAGMGFNELLHCGRCPAKGARPLPNMPMHRPMPMPSYADGQGNNIIIINTDGSDDARHFFKKHEKCDCDKDGENCSPKIKKHHNEKKKHHIESMPTAADGAAVK